MVGNDSCKLPLEEWLKRVWVEILYKRILMAVRQINNVADVFDWKNSPSPPQIMRARRRAASIQIVVGFDWLFITNRLVDVGEVFGR